MALSLSIKNVPESLAEALRVRAERNHRSMQGELMSILEQAVAESVTGADRHAMAPTTVTARPATLLSIDEVAAHARKLFPEGTPSSTDFIRAMRDGRYGQEWALTGQHVDPD